MLKATTDLSGDQDVVGLVKAPLFRLRLDRYW